MFPILTQLISVTYEKNSSRIVVVQTKIHRRRTRHVVRSRRSKRDVYQNGNLARKSRLVPAQTVDHWIDITGLAPGDYTLTGT